ncbi:MAG: response regulator [Cryomorphaceae bacterium]|nr:response regulator [Cryomorphaceae bacterium]
MSQPFKIFIVEDDLWYSEVLEYLLKQNPDCEVEKFSSGKDFLKNLHRRPSLVTLDYSMGDFNGDELLKKIHNFDPCIPVIMVSGQEDVSTALDLLRAGASDYIVKNTEAKDRLWNAVRNIREKAALQDEIDDLRAEVKQKYDFSSLIGNSQPMMQVKNLMAKACGTNIVVSITGDTGTGKEVVAKAIHYKSPRSKKPFVAVNVAAIPQDLIESELFGHERGAFTGAQATRIGKFEEANGGTLFLDEIGEMSANMQSKLLRALQEKEFQRVGSNNTIKVDVRIIVATHRNLADEVAKGNFREDLYYRLLGLTIDLPALKERGGDIVLIAKHFVDVFCKDNNLGIIELSPCAREKLLKYNFPGNVRELKAIIDLACVMCSNNIILAEDLKIQATKNNIAAFSEENTLEAYTVKIIEYFLDKYDNNVVLVANKLAVGKSTIYRMMKAGKIKTI